MKWAKRNAGRRIVITWHSLSKGRLNRMHGFFASESFVFLYFYDFNDSFSFLYRTNFR